MRVHSKNGVVSNTTKNGARRRLGDRQVELRTCCRRHRRRGQRLPSYLMFCFPFISFLPPRFRCLVSVLLFLDALRSLLPSTCRSVSNQMTLHSRRSQLAVSGYHLESRAESFRNESGWAFLLEMDLGSRSRLRDDRS